MFNRKKATPPSVRRTPERELPQLVSVVMPVRNVVDTIGDQLDALSKLTYEHPFEVIIADNGSTDGLRDYLESYPHRERLRLRWVDASATKGGSFARNVGVAAADGEFIAFCDGDDCVYPDWLSAMVAVGRYSSLVSGAVETHSLNSALVQSWRQMLAPEIPYHFPGFMTVATGCSIGVWKDMFDEVDGFDVSYDRGAEDADFSFRVQLAGGVHNHAAGALTAYRLRDTRRGIWDQSVMCGEGDARLYSDYRRYGMPRRPWYATVDLILYLAIRNPLLPTWLTRVPTGRWLFQAGNFVGRIRGSVLHSCFYI
ncbi:glycosyltransferase family A protein [Gordonia sp. ABSL1-1]|uniref:glycosyltransferase n=1 Tax=Gordonia sp. ABSL1-1 TaxID=3053923 RepID=UPI0025741628|nr:glycosyltransferase family A protein [Gordonia sp. ABSL1-1]MDL9936854.1 glycosyltransferase family A protein [Gordonia sp. ABSL1-1]